VGKRNGLLSSTLIIVRIVIALNVPAGTVTVS
jgi:hypothetical protein